MPADQLGHLEHRYLSLAAEHRLQLVVGVDHAPVLLVLKAVTLDVAPDLLGHLGTRHRARADHRRERAARRHRLHEGGIWLALLARLLRFLLRHLDFSSELAWKFGPGSPAVKLAVDRRCTNRPPRVNAFQREIATLSRASRVCATPPRRISPMKIADL